MNILINPLLTLPPKRCNCQIEKINTGFEMLKDFKKWLDFINKNRKPVSLAFTLASILLIPFIFKFLMIAWDPVIDSGGLMPFMNIVILYAFLTIVIGTWANWFS